VLMPVRLCKTLHYLCIGHVTASELAQNRSRIPRHDDFWRHIPGDHTAGSDDAALPDGYTFEDQAIHADENVIFDNDGGSIGLRRKRSTQDRVQWVEVGVNDRRIGSYRHVITDGDPFRGA